MKKKAENILKMDKLTKESYKNKIEKDAIIEIKNGFIFQDIIKNENIEVSDDEITEFVKPFAKKYKMGTDEFIKMYKDAGKLEIFKNKIETTKVIDFLYENIKTKKGEKTTFTEYLSNI